MAARRYGRFNTVHADDNELHVDVMRFFAIIAMCLFAILPHTDAPNVPAASDPGQQPAVVGMATPSVAKTIISVAQSPTNTRSRQNASAFIDQSTTPTDQDIVPPSPPIEQVAIKEPQTTSIPTATMPLKSKKAPKADPAPEQQQGVRFLNSDAFALAVTSGAITLVYHGQNESLVFDPLKSRFIRFVDESLQIFGLAASEVPPLFHSALPRIQRANMTEAQWFITLPEPTLAYLLDAQQKKGRGAVLNDRAQPI